MQLLDDVSITMRDLTTVKPFYRAIMAALGAALGFGGLNRPSDDGHTYLSTFESASANPDTRRHWCLRAGSAKQVDAYHARYYAAFLRDPEGNRVEAVFHRGAEGAL